MNCILHVKRIEFTMAKYYKGAGICSLNHGISLNSLNQDLSVLFFDSKHYMVGMQWCISLECNFIYENVKFVSLKPLTKLSKCQILESLPTFSVL